MAYLEFVYQQLQREQKALEQESDELAHRLRSIDAALLCVDIDMRVDNKEDRFRRLFGNPRARRGRRAFEFAVAAGALRATPGGTDLVKHKPRKAGGQGGP